MGKIIKLHQNEFYLKRARELFEDAFQYFVKENYVQAFNEFKRSQQIDPNNPEYAYYCGLTAYFLSKEESIHYFKKAVTLDSNTPKYYLWYGIASYEKGNYGEAKKIFLYLYALDPEYKPGRIYLAKVLNQMKQPDQVINFFKEGIGIPNLDYEELFELGNAYFHKMEFQNAIEMMKKSIEKEQTNTRPYFFLSRIYCKVGKFEEAMRIMRQLQTELPDENSRIQEEIHAIEFLNSF